MAIFYILYLAILSNKKVADLINQIGIRFSL